MLFGYQAAHAVTTPRWELQPIITSDAMGRLDPGKAVLLVRGHPGALIDKAFCVKEAGFKRQVQASADFRSKLTIPMVGAAEQEPPTIAPVLKADPRRHEIAKARVQEAASTVFLDPCAFEAAFVQAMGEPQNEAIAELCSDKTAYAKEAAKGKFGCCGCLAAYQ